MANVARITILVLLELVLKQTELAGLLHQTLGLLGFAIASVTIWWVLKRFMRSEPTKQTGSDADIADVTLTHCEFVEPDADQTAGPDANQPAEQTKSVSPQINSPAKHTILLSSAILVVIVTMNLLYQPQTIMRQTKVDYALTLPASYALKTSNLNLQEQTFFTSNQAQANKYYLTLSINDKPVKVAMVLVWSRAWKTHHVPENCYLSQGFSIDAQGVWQLPEHAMRYLQLNQPNSSKPGTPRTAAYWFQSANSSTPDYSSRVIDNLFNPGQNWVMASILFDQSVTPKQITPFIKTLKHAIGDQFHDIQ